MLDATAFDPSDTEALNAHLDALSKAVLPQGLRFRYMALADLKEQDLNARTMPAKMFEQLVTNIKATGALESLPLCVDMPNGDTRIISGHHRTRAGVKAGVTHSVVLVYDRLTKASVIAKQLAHNTISGSDDVQILKRLWDQIDEVPAKFEAFVDPKAFVALPKPVKFTPADIDLQAACKSVLLLFLPTQVKAIDRMLQVCVPEAHADKIYLASRETFDAWTSALRRLRSEAEIVAMPTAIAEMARLTVKAIDAGLHDSGEWVSLASVFGKPHLPPEVADVVRQAIDRKIQAGDVNPDHPWQALEQWAAETLAGA